MTTALDSDLSVMLEQGLELHKSGQLQQAEEKYREVLSQQPENADALHYLGLLAAQGNAGEAGIKLIEQSLSINPANAAAHGNLGNMLCDAGRLDEAVKHFQQSIGAEPEFAGAHNDLGRALMDLGQLEDAAKALTKSISLEAGVLESHSNLGLVYLSLGKADLAAKSFKQAVALNANIPDLYLNLSLALQTQGKLEEALEEIKRAEALAPDQADYAFNLGTIYQDLGKVDDAITAFERALSLDAKMFEAHCNLGAIFENQEGRLDDAIDHYHKALAIESNVAAVLVNLGNALQIKEQFDEAIASYEKALAISPDPATEIALRQMRAKQLPNWHFPMLADDARNSAYQKAIDKVVTPSTRVLDIGTGSGLLAMMAARAGAENVTACEVSPVLAAMAEKIVAKNGLSDRVNVIAKKSNDLVIGEDLDQRVDVIIAEVFDFGLLREGALPTLRHAVSQLAATDARIIPSSATVKGLLVELPDLRRVNPVGEIAGFDLSTFDDFRNPYRQIQDLNHENHRRLSDVFTVAVYDFTSLLPTATGDIETKLLQVKASDTGTAQAVVFWFDLDLVDGLILSSGPFDGGSHCGQGVQFLETDLPVTAGDDVPLTAQLGEMQITFKL